MMQRHKKEKIRKNPKKEYGKHAPKREALRMLPFIDPLIGFKSTSQDLENIFYPGSKMLHGV